MNEKQRVCAEITEAAFWITFLLFIYIIISKPASHENTIEPDAPAFYHSGDEV